MSRKLPDSTVNNATRIGDDEDRQIGFDQLEEQRARFGERVPASIGMPKNIIEAADRIYDDITMPLQSLLILLDSIEAPATATRLIENVLKAAARIRNQLRQLPEIATDPLADELAKDIHHGSTWRKSVDRAAGETT